MSIATITNPITPESLPPVRDYVAYESGQFRMAMDLVKLDLAEWIEIDDQLPAELAERRRLLTEQHNEVFASLPEGDDGSQEMLGLLVDHLTHYFPQVYQRDGAQLHNHATGEIWHLQQSTLHPLELAGRLVQEDLCLMGRDDETGLYRLTAACLCFPTRWLLAEKIGQTLGQIHAPVPTYDETLESPMDRLFDKLRVDRPVARLNWSVVDDPTLFQPRGRGNPNAEGKLTADNAGERLWMRMERQTLRRLPQSQDILFTIRIYVHPLADLADKPERAAQLAEMLRSTNAHEIGAYKSMPAIFDATMDWLARVETCG